MGGGRGESSVCIISRTYAVISVSSKVGDMGEGPSPPELFLLHFTIS